MKANEAPEKIWVHELSAMELDVPLKAYHIEYTRTDAFIEKAAKWIEENANNYTERIQTIIGSVKIVNTEKMANDFKKAMI